ncbi:uncharacterized protein [Procambarus clarkii]|uniref:uncharacterized protein n=1 Tax=Procambarus clarkii TaxID=6728 RepID=UPI0037421003
MEDQVAALVDQSNFGKIKDLTKSGLLLLADRLNLAIPSKMLKAQVLRTIVTHLVEEERLEEECVHIHVHSGQGEVSVTLTTDSATPLKVTSPSHTARNSETTPNLVIKVINKFINVFWDLVFREPVTHLEPGGQTAPGSSKKAPGSSKKAPGSSKKDPGSSKKAPGSSKKAPGSSKKAPGSSKKAPGSSKNAPGSSKNAPGSSKKAPGSSKKHPGVLKSTREF